MLNIKQAKSLLNGIAQSFDLNDLQNALCFEAAKCFALQSFM